MALTLDGKTQLGTTPLYLGSLELSDYKGCFRTSDFHAHGLGGVAGYYKMRHGTTPTAHKEAGHSILWADAADKLYFEKADGTDIEIPLAPAVEYLQASKGTDQTNFDTGDDIKFDTVNISAGTSISLNTSTGVFTLEAGKTYKLATGIRFEYSDTAKIGFAWYDITNSAEISVLASLRTQSSAAHYSTLPVVETIITPTVETQVSVRCVWEGDEVEDVNAGYVWAIIEVMAGTTSPIGVWDRSGTNLSPVTAGDDVLLNAGETLSIADMTTGSVPFIGVSGLFSQDNSNLFYDDAANELKIGGGYGSTGVTIDSSGNINMNGKLTVDGLIDPTGIVLNEQASSPWTPAAGKAAIWIKDDGSGMQFTNSAGITENVPTGSGTIIEKSTGLIKGGVISVNGGDNTLIDITAGSGQIVDSTTDPDNPVLIPVTWIAKTGYDLTTMPDPGDVVAIFLSLDSGGNVIEGSALPTAEERRDYINLGIVARLDNGLIVFAGSGPTNVIHNPTAQLQDLMEAWGTFNVDGNRIQPNAADLQIKKTEGSVFCNGANFQTNGENPHVVLLSEQAPVSPFNYKLGDGTDVTLGATQLDPDKYDDGTSTPATVANNRWTVQLVSVFASGVVEVLYGQEVFANEEEAITAISNIDFIIPVDSKGAVQLAYVVLQQGDTAVTSDRIYRVTRGGSGGGSVSYWNRTNTELSPANAGDSAILATQTELSTYPNFSADPEWTFSGSNTWAYDGTNDRMRPLGEVAGDTITDTGIALTSGKTYVVSLSWLKFIGTGYLQIYQGSGGTQKSDYINDGTHSSIKWMFTATADENLFIRSTGDFHSDTTVNYINELSVIEIDNAGDIIGDKLALGGAKPEYYSQLDNYEDISLFIPSNKGIFTVDEFILRNINSGGLDFGETYARPMLSSYATSVVLGSNGYNDANIRADGNINLRTYTAGGTITLNESLLDTDFVLNGSGVEAYKYDAGNAAHVFNGSFNVVGLLVYANNAAAITGGLTAGAFYRTDDFLKIVH